MKDKNLNQSDSELFSVVFHRRNIHRRDLALGLSRLGDKKLKPSEKDFAENYWKERFSNK